MVNEEKVKIMNRLAMYEHGEGRKYLPVSRYYRSDYIGLALIRNFFLVTIGYVLGLAGVAAYFSEYLMDNVNKINLVKVGIYIIVGYLIVLVVYSILTAYLAERLSVLTGIPWNGHLVKKIRSTRSQKKLNAIQRRQNLKNAYQVTERIPGFSVLVVDDVYTTGSTADAMAMCLLEAGAEKVYFLTICAGRA